jgi:hypothetical protein
MRRDSISGWIWISIIDDFHNDTSIGKWFFAHELRGFTQTVFLGVVSVIAGGNPRNPGSDPEAAQPPLDSEAL